jgi:hypothetical protein
VNNVKTPLITLLLALVTGCLGDPDVDQGLAPARTSVVAGDAVVAVPLPEPRRAVLFLLMVADADGNPVPGPNAADVTIIPESAFAEGGNGVRTGSFAFGLVSPGTYNVAGIVDVDQNFDLLVPELALPSAADLLGGYADVVTGELIPIEIEPNQFMGEVTVLFSPPPS